MPEMYFKIKADREFYENVYDTYKRSGKLKKQSSLDAQLKVVITALKTLERMH